MSTKKYFLSFRDFASTETIDTSALASKKERLDDLDQANAEIEKLRKLGEKLTGELQGTQQWFSINGTSFKLFQ